MARSKLQWRAEKKRAAQQAALGAAELLQLKTEHPQLVEAPVSRAPEALEAPSGVEKSAAPPKSAAVIDLTAGGEEEEEEEDEELPVLLGEAEGEAMAVEDAGRVGEERNEDGTAALEQVEGEESDVDEDWPTVEQSGTSTPETQELEDDNDEEEENSREGSLQQAPETAALNSVMDLEEDEMEVDEELPVASKASAVTSSETEPATDWAGRILRIVETAAIRNESLENGEIFEVGAVATSPASIKRAIAFERLGSREDSSSDAGSSHSQQNATGPGKQKKTRKKRGKKKRKRELEAMMAEFAMPTSAPMGFERITRQDALPNTLTDGFSHPAVQAAVGIPTTERRVQFAPRFPPPPPPPRPMSFGGPPPPPRVLPPHMIPSQIGPPPPPPPQGLAQFSQHPGFRRHLSDPITTHPPYESNQIMRVNRQGSIEMLGASSGILRPPPQIVGGEAAPPHTTIPVNGAFRYRSIAHPVQPKRMVQLIQSKSNGEQSKVGSLAAGKTAPPSNESHDEDFMGREKQPDGYNEAAESGLDLDVLRAMALRTKRTPRSQPQAQGEKASDPSCEKDRSANASDTTVTNNKNKTDIDELRAEILRSMARKTKKQKMSGIEHSSSKGAEAVEDDTRSSDLLTSDSNNTPRHIEDNVAEARPVSAVQVAPPKSALGPAPAKPSSALVAPAATEAHDAPPTPVIRPLTACSQSLVIRLDEDDLILASGDGESTGLGSPLCSTEAPRSIQSAIEEMRKKIAGLERERAGTIKTKPVSSSASSSTASSQRSSPHSPHASAVKASAASRTLPPPVITTFPKSTSASPASSSGSSSTNPSPESLQSKIRAMKEQIAAKEREKRLRSELLRQVQLKQKALSKSPISPPNAVPLGQQSVTKAICAVTDAGGSASKKRLDAVQLERWRTDFEASVKDMSEACRELVLVDAELARLEHEIAARSSD